MLAFRIIPSIFVFVSFAIFIMSFTYLCTFIIASNSFNILWYNLVQLSCFFLNSFVSFMLLSFLVMYGLGEVGAVM